MITISLCPPVMPKCGLLRTGIKPLFYFFVKRVLTLPRAVLFQFQPFFDFLLVALGVVINTLTHRALKFDEIILRHKVPFCVLLEPAVGFEPTTYCLQNSCSTTELCRREPTLVGRAGFEPAKAQGHLVYSQTRLTASVPTRSFV